MLAIATCGPHGAAARLAGTHPAPFQTQVFQRSMTTWLKERTLPSAASPHACSIRSGVVADATALADFAARTFTDTYGEDNRAEDLQMHLASSYTQAHQMRELSDPDVATLLARSGGELIAYAQVRRCNPLACVTGDAPVELHRFYVDKPWHGRGISQQLLGEVRMAARAFGGASLWLKVWEHNPRAIAFYSKAGFVDVGTADFYVGSDRQTDRVLMLDLRA